MYLFSPKFVSHPGSAQIFKNYLFGCAWFYLRYSGSLIFTGECGIFFFFFSCGMWDLVPWPEIKPQYPALGAWSLSHQSTKEVPNCSLWCTSFKCWCWQQTIKLKRKKNFIQVKLRIITQETDSRKSWELFCPLEGTLYTFWGQRILHQNDILKRYLVQVCRQQVTMTPYSPTEFAKNAIWHRVRVRGSHSCRILVPQPGNELQFTSV